ncbi:SAM-dependent methyltransferase [Candidatus Pelagibacter ubique]|jgi:cyclopropane-fatty-acyl-phospholipid synthase|uniref:SAM-dependent methyltransferase n=1 Tax=Pelagibacter ubique TaxID=198252 RepID=UPI0023330064|nr:cyclopropane-fatty-acyl-phospholipid synthase family protein [Candidatus Pelagibacter ubique]MDB9728365.1 cyclopropane-fatty-acyl-phospholipid synthase family protein [Candidatus Pelagibacter ubique]MDC0391160.1 cyclopropane-fatty-acyl-phospholipid synthase family protein [Candidatus Pelagibacter ubique]
MQLARYLNKLFQKDGFLLIDANSNKYIIGTPKNNKPITVKILDKKLHYKLFFRPDLYFGEAYSNGDIQIENGSLTDFLDIALMNIGRGELNFFSMLINKLYGSYRYLTNFNFIKKSKMNVAHHYDLSDDLYSLFLDPKKQYSCGYFINENDTLEDAQNNKIQHIIKKLNIKPNQKVLDIGCGWGSLAIDIAKSNNCEVTGITLSENQFNYCVKKAKKLNLENQVTFKLIDYRQLDEKFDRIVSVGMFEHVGRKFYKNFFKKIDNLLNDDGVSLVHTIGSVNPPRDPHPWITKYIFPGGYTPSLSEVVTPVEKAGLIVSDIEVLKLHYSHTLRHWKENCIKNKIQIINMFDEKFFRMWEFYLASCESAFKWGDQVVYQFQLTKNYMSTPNTRDYIYK